MSPATRPPRTGGKFNRANGNPASEKRIILNIWSNSADCAACGEAQRSWSFPVRRQGSDGHTHGVGETAKKSINDRLCGTADNRLAQAQQSL